MPGTAFLQKYNVLKILYADAALNCYIANQNGRGSDIFFLVNEICDRNFINHYISEIMTLKKETLAEFEEFFAENSRLYVVFLYQQGTSVCDFLKQGNFSFAYRVALLQKIACRLAENPAVGRMFQITSLMPENIVIQEEQFSFNYQLFLSSPVDFTEKKELYMSFGKLVQLFFSEKEIAAYSSLAILVKKADKGIYHSFGELLKDLEGVSCTLDKKETVRTARERKRKKAGAVVSYLFGLAVLCLACFVLYQKINDSRVEEAVYTDIDKIGTVPVKNEAPPTILDTEEDSIIIENGAKEEMPEPPEPVPAEAEEQKVEKEQAAEENPELDGEIEEPLGEAEPPVQQAEPALPVDENGISYKTYVVQLGDSLTKISRREYGTDEKVGYLQNYNGIKNGSAINPGQVIRIPVEN